MANGSKFSAKRVSNTRDLSTMKSLIAGGPGVGKTFFVSTIVSADGRPVFLLSVEEGGKGVSPNHHPAHFTDARDKWIIPETWLELVDAMTTFRDGVNAFRPPAGWGVADDAPEKRMLDELVAIYPAALPIAELAEKAEEPLAQAPKLLRALVDAGKAREVPLEVRKGRDVTKIPGFRALPDSTWQRPHIHLGVDSLSGVEKLIHAYVCGREQVESMADKDYNALWNKALPLWEQFLTLLDSIRATGVHVWIVAHTSETIDAAAKTGSIYRKHDIQMRGTNKVLDEARSTIRNWADNVLYIIRDVRVIEGDKKRRARAEFTARRLITTDTGQWAAKTRQQVPVELPATWADWSAAVRAGASAKPEKLRAKIDVLLPRLDDESRTLFEEELKVADSATKLAAALSRIEGMVACAEGEALSMSTLTGEGAGTEGDGTPAEPAAPGDVPPPPSGPQVTTTTAPDEPEQRVGAM